MFFNPLLTPTEYESTWFTHSVLIQPFPEIHSFRRTELDFEALSSLALRGPESTAGDRPPDLADSASSRVALEKTPWAACTPAQGDTLEDNAFHAGIS